MYVRKISHALIIVSESQKVCLLDFGPIMDRQGKGAQHRGICQEHYEFPYRVASNLTAQILYSGILAIGSRAAIVSSFALASGK